MKKMLAFLFVLAFSQSFVMGQVVWDFNEKYDPFTDENTSNIILSTVEGPDAFTLGAPESLVIRCEPSLTPPFEVFVNFDEFMASLESTFTADVRWDREEATQATLSRSSSYMAGFVQESNRNQWIENIRTYDQLVIRAEDSRNVLTFEFPDEFVAEMNTLPCLP